MRALAASEGDAFCDGAADPDALRPRLSGDLAAGTVQLQWCWIAEVAGEVRARHHWWGPIGSRAPVVLVPVSTEDNEVAADLVVAARDALGIDEAWAEITLRGAAGDPWTDRAGD